jgi:hypothetical protein
MPVREFFCNTIEIKYGQRMHDKNKKLRTLIIWGDLNNQSNVGIFEILKSPKWRQKTSRVST